MGRVVVIEFVTLDGVVADPDGSAGLPGGGWAFRHGPEAVAGDKFELGETLDLGALLLGRRTWQLFSRLWPSRTDPFAQRMNRVRKLVVSRSRPDLSAWAHSEVLAGDLPDAVRRESEDRDLVLAGSTSVLRALQGADLVDEYRLLTFPTVVGGGDRLFDDRPLALRNAAAAVRGPAVLTSWLRER
ncbi:dihydrofolate reductase family protein [Nakamurella endophytica]|uniref:Riboflavin biosynthesis protein RibD n=1 Tax=Nakamurella endophytica TaxID=1748367 RepID=A0A917WJW2_9ACTN|nr:dihydrofolate reductase family protein [Nakamurella endophytica]GGM11289.1 riboflavin biosynthesis protein RibD [Nakamurella endophytica]